MRKIIILPIIALLVISGCGGNTSNVPTSSEVPTPISTPTGEPSSNDGQIKEYLPVGFALQRSCQKNAPCQINGESYADGSELILMPASGETAVSIYLAGFGEVLHVAGPVDFSHPEELVYIYRALETDQIHFIKNGQVTQSLNGQNIARFIGAAAQQVLAMTYLPGTTDSGNSEIQVYPGAGPLVTAPGPEFLLFPVAIQGNGHLPPDNQYVSLWYTHEPYGIGGDIVFRPFGGLYYFLGNGERHEEFLPQEAQFSALSPDSNLTAFTYPPAGGIVIRNFNTGKETEVPLLEGNDRGAGDAVFSPDSKKLAWMEAGGSLAYGDLTSTIRIATTAGEILAEFSADTLKQASGFSNVITRPVGWIDGERVLLQVHVTRDYGDMQLLIARTDGTIEDTVLTGRFIGLVYEE
jgi:hypothetical protein